MSSRHYRDVDKIKKEKVHITILIIIILLVLIVAGIITTIIVQLNKYADLVNYETESSATVNQAHIETITSNKPAELLEYEKYLEANKEKVQSLPANNNVTNILLIGTDNREEDDDGRSDSMMIVSINSSTKTIVITSIMRDIYLKIPGYGYNRINAAYAFGGPDLLMKTIKINFGISIDRYVKVDFFSFIKVIDTLGGIDIKVYSKEIEVMQEYIRELNRLLGNDENDSMLYPSNAGKIHLNGIQALAYCRDRYTGNADFERTNRQRKVFTQIISKTKNLKLRKINNFANSLLPNLITNMKKSEVLSLILHSIEYSDYRIISFRVPTDDTWKSVSVDDMDVLTIDIEKNCSDWKKRVYGTN